MSLPEKVSSERVATREKLSGRFFISKKLGPSIEIWVSACAIRGFDVKIKPKNMSRNKAKKYLLFTPLIYHKFKKNKNVLIIFQKKQNDVILALVKNLILFSL